MSRYARRRLVNYIYLTLSMAATAFGLIFLVLILYALLRNGIPALSLTLFTEVTPPPGSAGGLANAIFGSIAMTLVATLVGTPVGILTGTFLAEFGKNSAIAPVVRFVNDILLSAPSIIIGLFVYGIIVVQTHHFSAWAGSIALALIVMPVVIRTTEDMLTLVPASLREAASALGTPQWRVITQVIYRAALQGLLTGVMLAVARIAGETAPLLFTALNNQFWSTDMNAPMANLPVVIFQFALSPYADWRLLAWGGAMLITMSILILNILARFLASWSNRTP
jgi:phosphate transport system permease protein